MNISQALNILKPENNSMEALKAAYRTACKKYHPDINPDGLELMKVVNAAYDFLKTHLGKWSTDQATTEQGIDEIFQEILDKIRHLPQIEIEICGTWLWVTGETFPVKDELKAAGLRFARKKKAWYWRPEGYRKRSKREFSLPEIRMTFGSEEVDTQPLAALA